MPELVPSSFPELLRSNVILSVPKSISPLSDIIPFNKELKTYGIPNDLDGGSPFWPSRYQDGKVYSFKYSYQLKSVLDHELIDKAEYKDQGLRNKLIAFRETLSDDDGPILIEIELK